MITLNRRRWTMLQGRAEEVIEGLAKVGFCVIAPLAMVCLLVYLLVAQEDEEY